MALNMRIFCLLTIQALLLCTPVVSAEEPKEKNGRNIRSVRKRVNEKGEITDETKDDVEIGRQYLESLWDSVEKNNERKLEKGRMRYLESMMGVLSMSMSVPTKAPAKPNPDEPTSTKKPTSPTPPTVPAPTRSPIRGPTLPTREPIPTKAPIPAPSTVAPVEEPTVTKKPVTPSPTRPCNEAERKTFLLQFLSLTTESSIVSDKDTPQGKAYSFLLEEEPSFVCSSTLLQRYGLSTFYFAMEGSSWTNNDGWLGNKHECNWYGVDCDDNKFSTSLNLAVNNLKGKIPDEISVLSTLEKLDLFFNSVTGTLPDGLSELENLATLDVQQNLLTGEAFPSSITNSPSLVSYRISNNKLSGGIPSEIGSLKNLKELWAGDNEITGEIPSEIGDLRNLKTLLFQNNKLEGEVPTQLGLIPLEGLVMNDNQFLGRIPSQLFNVASLDTIRLDRNLFTGTLPDAIGQLTDIKHFRVEHNKLSGQIPKTIGSMTSLVNLRLNKNSWNGTVPDVFENYEQLDFFDISNNNLRGSIPKTLFSIPTLRLAYMSNCSLSGSIPDEYADPPDLRDLYLDNNELTGTIPPIAPGQLEKLSEFLLQGNKIEGTMPDSICSLRSNFILDDLWTNCGGGSHEIECDFPECCNRCFEKESFTTLGVEK